MVSALIVAAGKGERMGAGMNKAYLLLDGKTILEHTAEVFKALKPLNDYFHEIVEVEELAKALLKEEKQQQLSQPEPEIKMVKAPDVEFMW